MKIIISDFMKNIVIVSSNPSQPAAKAMLHAIGLNDKELSQPFHWNSKYRL